MRFGGERAEGVVRSIREGGFGFIRPLGGNEDVYFRVADTCKCVCEGREGGGGCSTALWYETVLTEAPFFCRGCETLFGFFIPEFCFTKCGLLITFFCYDFLFVFFSSTNERGRREPVCAVHGGS